MAVFPAGVFPDLSAMAILLWGLCIGSHVMQVTDRSSWQVFNEGEIVLLNVLFRLMLAT